MVELRRDESGVESGHAEHTLYSVFEQQAARRPDHAAVIDARGEHRYRDVSLRALALAARLVELGASRGALVALLCEKGVHQVAGALGIMRSGAAYLPLDPDWPTGRMEEILDQAAVRIIALTRAQLRRIEDAGLAARYTILVLDDPAPASVSVSGSASGARLPDLRSSDIAYVIFTSGSTGRPKGAIISHEGALTTIAAVNDRFGVTAKDSVLAVSRLTFDLSVYDIFGMLHAGGTIVFPREDRAMDPLHWQRLIQTYKITLWNTVPQLMELLLDAAGPAEGSLESLRCVLLSGDWIPLPLPDRVRRHAPRATVVSLGGATEGSIWSIWYVIDRVEPGWRSIPYGFAMPDQQIHVLDEHGDPSPAGETGHIFIGGKGVALGYWNDPENTARCFEDHPALGRLFRTGDLGSLDAAGYVVFLGRRDHQVKINGYRIELEEIAAKLGHCPGIGQAVVLVKASPGAAAHLAAYYVPREPVSALEIRAFLSRHLPEFMVPRAYHAVAAIPLNENGKVDRAALLRIGPSGEEDYVPPRSEIEEKACRIWAEGLGVERLGITGDFFRNGGDSLLAIRLACALSLEFDRHVGPHLILSHPNVGDFVRALNTEDDLGAIPRVDRPDGPLSFQQEASLAEELRRPRNGAFPMAFELTGAASVPMLKASLARVVQKQAALRTRYVRDDQGGYRQIAGDDALVIDERRVTEAELHRIFEGVYHTPFDLSADLPIRATIYHTERASYLLVIAHTIAFDGWSISVFVDDLAAAFAAHGGEAPGEAGAAEIRYVDYARWQRRRIAGERLDELLGYWRGKLAGYRPFTLGPPPPEGQAWSARGAYVDFALDPATSDRLRQLAREQETTLFTILLTALYALVHRHTRQDDLAIASLVANRTHPEMEHVIGNFYNKQISRIRVDRALPAAALVARVHEALMESAEHAEAPFDLVMKDVAPGHDPARFFPVLLNVHDFRSHLSESRIQEHLKVIPVQRHFDIARCDVELFINPGREYIKGLVIYGTDRHDRRFAEMLKDEFTSILRSLAARADTAVGDLAGSPLPPPARG